MLLTFQNQLTLHYMTGWKPNMISARSRAGCIGRRHQCICTCYTARTMSRNGRRDCPCKRTIFYLAMLSDGHKALQSAHLDMYSDSRLSGRDIWIRRNMVSIRNRPHLKAHQLESNILTNKSYFFGSRRRQIPEHIDIRSDWFCQYKFHC